MEVGSLPVVRIADDGELGDVRQLLEQLGVEWVAAGEEPERATALLVATPKYLIGARAGERPDSLATYRIAVADKMTRGLQREIERARPDFLVSRPFHAAALRLLILHALYIGPERRASARVAMSLAIRFRSGVFSRAATLVELSRGGCRLVVARAPASGESVTVILPREATGGVPLSLSGRVVGLDPAGGFEPGEQACSVSFEALDPDKRRALRAIMAKQSIGGATLEPRAGGALAPAPEAAVAPAKSARKPTKESAASAKKGRSERRRSPRGTYARPVLASSGGAARTLMGRDLSSGGMRVAAGADLIVGDELKLIVYGPAGSAPLLLRSQVARDDGADGFVLRFVDLAPEVVAELDAWVQRLPGRGDAEPDAPSALHSVVSEIVEES
ncbi:MAG TPA: PilZ domain-containing protein [Myxococcota bacterium]|nr:PilZ domain-containing protein [Myxococcota bacterium]